MAYALVSGQFASATPAGVTTVNVVLPNNPTAGNLVVVTFGTNSPTGTFTCHDSVPNAYSPTTSTPSIDTFDGIAVGCFYLIAPVGATKTITLTFPSASTGDVFAAEFSGGATTSVFENDATARSVGVTSVVLPSYTTLNNGDLLIGVAAPVASLSGVGAPWTNWPTGVGANGGASEYFVQSTAGAQAVAFTAGASTNVAALIAAFKVAAAAVAGPGIVARNIFVPGRRQGPTRGLRPTQNFAPPPPPPFVYIQDPPVWRSTAAAVLLLATTAINASWVPQPPPTVAVAPALGWLQPLAVPLPLPPRQYDPSVAWVPQPSFNAAPTTTLEWLQPLATPLPPPPRRYDYTTWVPQPSFNAPPTTTVEWLQPFPTSPRETVIFDADQAPFAVPAIANITPAALGWLQPFSTQAAAKPFYDLNQSWVPQPPPAAAITPSTLGWLQPFATPTAAIRSYDLNQAWVPQVPAVVAPTPTLGWLQPFATPLPPPRIQYDLNTAWVPQPSFNAAPTKTLEWLQPFAAPLPTPPRRYDLNITWVPQPSFNAAPTKTLEWLNPFPQQTAPRPVYDLNQGWIPQPPSAVAITPSPLGWLQPFPITRETVVVSSISYPATQPPTVTAVTPSSLGWLQPFPTQIRPPPFYDLNQSWVPQVPAVVVPPVAPPFGWFTQDQSPPRETVVPSTVLAPFVLPDVPTWGWEAWSATPPRAPRVLLDVNQYWVPQPPAAPVVTTPSILGWLQPFSIPRQPVRLWDWNTAWPAQPPPVAITPAALGWLQAFATPSIPGRFYDLNQGWVPQPPSAVAITPAPLGWLQPFSVPQQPVRLWDWNTAWPPSPPPPVAVTPSTLGWLQPFPITRETVVVSAISYPATQPPPSPVVAPPFGWFTQDTLPPRETVVPATILSPFVLPDVPTWGWEAWSATPLPPPWRPIDTNQYWIPQPPAPPAVTPSTLGWLQAFPTPPQPVRLWDWNTAWPPAPPPPFAITPAVLGWLQAFPMPPQPPPRPTFNEIYIAQNVGGTAPIPPPPPIVPPSLAGQAGGTGHGSRTRNYRMSMTRSEFDRLIAQLPVEEQTQMRIELENDEIEWILRNLDDPNIN